MRPLTPRQEQVLHMRASGYSTSGIATRLTLSDETIRYHLKCAYRNLGVHNLADALIALEEATPRCHACGRPFEDATP